MKLEIEPISDALLGPRKSDTLFILGSGSSINEHDKAFWKQVEHCDSVGLNNWMVHWFVPDFYMREFANDPAENKKYFDLLIAKSPDFSNIPWILRMGDTKRRARVFPSLYRLFRSRITGPIFLPNVVNVPAETESEMRQFCKIWRRLGMHRRPNLHINIRASVCQLIYLGFIRGHTKIVLCGIDLSTKDYFWEDSRWEGPNYGLMSNNTNTPQHRTMDPDLGLPIDKIIYILNEEFLSPNGVKLFTASKSSALSERLPLYNYR